MFAKHIHQTLFHRLGSVLHWNEPERSLPSNTPHKAGAISGTFLRRAHLLENIQRQDGPLQVSVPLILRKVFLIRSQNPTPYNFAGSSSPCPP